jgi:hypothetical protein
MSNGTLDRTAGSPSLAAAGQRERWASTIPNRDKPNHEE